MAGNRRLALCLAVLCALTVPTAGGDAQVLALEAVLVAAASAAMAGGIRRHRPDLRGAWWLLLAAPWGVLLGEVARQAVVATGGGAVAEEATGVLAVAGYVLAAAGLLRLVRHGGRAHEAADHIDLAVVVVAVACLAWGVISPEFPHDGAAGLIERAVEVSTVVASAAAAVLACAALGATDRGRRGAAWWLVAAGGLLAGQHAVLPFLHRVVDVPHLRDVLLLLVLIMIAAAATHPTMAVVGSRATRQGDGVGLRLLALVVALIAPPAVVLLDRISGGPVDADLLLLAWALVSVVVVHRVLALVRDRDRLLHALQERSGRDDLTGLRNRRALLDIASEVFARADAEGTATGLLYLDLDGFKPVNDRHGHRAGDRVLQVVADRLAGEVGRAGTVARIGGDEFVVLLHPIASRAALLRMDHLVRARLAEPVDAEGTVVSVRASVGRDLRLPGGHGVEESLAHADRAMYAEKAARILSVPTTRGPAPVTPPASPAGAGR